MWINKLLKMLAGISILFAAAERSFLISAVTLPSSPCEDPVQPCSNPVFKLPPECKDFKVIRGDVGKSRTLIFGEVHKVCDKSRKKCTQALLKQKLAKKESTTILFEGAGYDKQVLCENAGVEKFAKECHGWNIKHADFIKKSNNYLKYNALTATYTEFDEKIKEIIELPENQQKDKLIKFTEEYIQLFEQMIEREKANIKAHKNKIKDIYSDDEAGLPAHEYQLEEAKKLLRNIKQSRKISKHLLYELHMERYDLSIFLNKWGMDAKEMIQKPNRSLASAIKAHSKKSKTIVAYVGDAHVNKKRAHESNSLFRHQAINELYKELDKFADENPYAVLSCTL